MLDALRYCVTKVGVELDEALRMASTYPAAFLGLAKIRGKLLPGYEDHVLIIDQKLNLKR